MEGKEGRKEKRRRKERKKERKKEGKKERKKGNITSVQNKMLPFHRPESFSANDYQLKKLMESKVYMVLRAE